MWRPEYHVCTLSDTVDPSKYATDKASGPIYIPLTFVGPQALASLIRPRVQNNVTPKLVSNVFPLEIIFNMRTSDAGFEIFERNDTAVYSPTDYSSFKSIVNDSGAQGRKGLVCLFVNLGSMTGAVMSTWTENGTSAAIVVVNTQAPDIFRAFCHAAGHALGLIHPDGNGQCNSNRQNLTGALQKYPNRYVTPPGTSTLGSLTTTKWTNLDWDAAITAQLANPDKPTLYPYMANSLHRVNRTEVVNTFLRREFVSCASGAETLSDLMDLSDQGNSFTEVASETMLKYIKKIDTSGFLGNWTDKDNGLDTPGSGENQWDTLSYVLLVILLAQIVLLLVMVYMVGSARGWWTELKTWWNERNPPAPNSPLGSVAAADDDAKVIMTVNPMNQQNQQPPKALVGNSMFNPSNNTVPIVENPNTEPPQSMVRRLVNIFKTQNQPEQKVEEDGDATPQPDSVDTSVDTTDQDSSNNTALPIRDPQYEVLMDNDL